MVVNIVLLMDVVMNAKLDLLLLPLVKKDASIVTYHALKTSILIVKLVLETELLVLKKIVILVELLTIIWMETSVNAALNTALIVVAII